MFQITIPQMKDAITYVAQKHGDVPMFWGPPGIGKTRGAHQWCAENGALLVDVRLGQYDSVDIRGIPGINHDDGLTVWHPASTLPFEGNDRFPDDRLILVFLDEFTSCNNAVFGVAYQLSDEKCVGEFKLKPNVIVVCAGNRDGDRGVTNRMPLPLCNRLVHFEVGVDPDAWCFYAQEQNWPAEGIAFIKFRKSLLHTFDPKLPDKDFATPRTWEKALTYFADPDMPQFIKQASMAGAVGSGPAQEFWGFVDIWQKMIPMSDIQRDPHGCRVPEQTEASMQYALAVAVSGSMTLQSADTFHIYLKRLGAEFVVLAWQLALARDKSLYGAKSYLDLAATYKAVFA